MNLPELSTLRNDQSTYISFSKALLDFDIATTDGTPCYFTKMVALNLPDWKNPNFFMNLSSVGISNTNPNYAFPKSIQYYMENIIRQNIHTDGISPIEEIVELAFWKMLNKMGLDLSLLQATVTFANTISTANFVKTENNNGWGEIVCQVPNKCKLLIPAWKSVANIAPLVQCDDIDTALYDNGFKQFVFETDNKKILDFQNFIYNDVLEQEFQFNILLLFYIDITGIEKLHGINFIFPFEDKVAFWDLKRFIQQTNIARTIGYQFKFNMKTCNNEATLLQVMELQEHSHWNVFFDAMSKMNTFLENKVGNGTNI